MEPIQNQFADMIAARKAKYYADLAVLEAEFDAAAKESNPALSRSLPVGTIPYERRFLERAGQLIRECSRDIRELLGKSGSAD